MFGDKWQAVTGKVLEVHKQGEHRGQAVQYTFNNYVVEATVPGGEPCREELDGVIAMRAIRLDVGDAVALLYSARKRSLKWDEDDRDLQERRGIADLDAPEFDAFRDSSGKIDRDKLLESVLHPPTADGGDAG